MRGKGFMNGLFTGSVVGAIVGLFVAPQLKPDTKKTLKNKGDMVQHRARKAYKGLRNTVKGLIK